MFTTVRKFLERLLLHLCPNRQRLEKYIRFALRYRKKYREERQWRKTLQMAHKEAHNLFKLGQHEIESLRTEVAGHKVSIISQAAMLAHPDSIAAALVATIAIQNTIIAEQAKKLAIMEENKKGQTELIQWLWSRVPPWGQ